MNRASIVLLFACAACGPGEDTKPPPNVPKALPVGSVEHFFPLEDGHLYNYATSEGPDTGMMVAKVKRTDATHGELRLSNRSDRFVYSAQGVAYETSGIFVLKEPLEVGTTWPGEHGGSVRIESVNADVKVPAGTYTGCVRTIEENGRMPGAKYVTSFCPGIGMVLVDITAPAGEAKIELRSYGLPIKID